MQLQLPAKKWYVFPVNKPHTGSHHYTFLGAFFSALGRLSAGGPKIEIRKRRDI